MLLACSSIFTLFLTQHLSSTPSAIAGQAQKEKIVNFFVPIGATIFQ